MCGISGWLAGDDVAPRGRKVLDAMTHALRHRGPDDADAWADDAAGVALGHARLSILDLSPSGHQPMTSADGRFVVTFNGEVYNFRELRDALERRGHVFHGTSDTEVLLAAFSEWGVAGALPRLVGMFAFGAWDREREVLHLARDRFGEKPLYHGWSRGHFLFASELKAFRPHPDFVGGVDRDALALLLRHNVIPAPYAIHPGFAKLPPGTRLEVMRHGSASPVPYWSMRDVAARGTRARASTPPEALVDRLEALLGNAVGRQMVADVPLGAFLSGGVDSSTIVALMQARAEAPVRTFTIGFHESAYDEAADARAVAEHLGTEHTELYVTPQDAMAVIPRLARIYDEPFADSSQIPTFLVAEFARRHVTVALSGDGGDEVFGGYNRHAWVPSIWGGIRRVPGPLRRGASSALKLLSPSGWNRLFDAVGPALPRAMRQRIPGEKIHKLADALGARSARDLHLAFASHWRDPASVVVGAREPPTHFTGLSPDAELEDLGERMMYLDTVTYLPDDILVKVDRASMAVSLEVRAPFLDPTVVEFAWTLPRDMRVRDGLGKWILRRVLHRHVPRELVERPKMGFGVPIGDWLRGPLRGWAEALLDEARLRKEGFLRPEPVTKLWREHVSGRRDRQHHLWDVLMFQLWLEESKI